MVEILRFVKEVVDFSSITAVFQTIISVIILFSIILIAVSFVKLGSLRHVVSNKQKSNVQIFSLVFTYSFLILLVFFSISLIESDWGRFGLELGLLSVAFGWKLQKSITGIAAWIIVVIKRQFNVFGRIIIDQIRGDVNEISLTNKYLNKIDRLFSDKKNSGQLILISKLILFKQSFINLKSKEDFIPDQFVITITYKNYLNESNKLIFVSVNKEIEIINKKNKKEQFIRNYLQTNRIEIRVIYFASSRRLLEFPSNITKSNSNSSRKVEFSYPHTEIIYRKKDRGK